MARHDPQVPTTSVVQHCAAVFAPAGLAQKCVPPPVTQQHPDVQSAPEVQPTGVPNEQVPDWA
jgi:hypothetical protein